MLAYEFLTRLTDTQAVIISHEVARKLQKGAPVRVLILVDEDAPTEEQSEEALVDFPSLEEIVTKIQRMGSNPKSIMPGGGKLAEKLAHSLTESDPEFDLETWTRKCDRIEAEMKAQSLAYEEAEQ